MYKNTPTTSTPTTSTTTTSTKYTNKIHKNIPTTCTTSWTKPYQQEFMYEIYLIMYRNKKTSCTETILRLSTQKIPTSELAFPPPTSPQVKSPPVSMSPLWCTPRILIYS